MTDAYATIKVLASTQKRRLIRVVVNQRVPGIDGRNVTAQLQQVIDRYVSPGLEAPLTLELIGDVPSDASVRDAVRRRQLVGECFPGSPAALALAAVADKLGRARL
jgi:flagellar biosynthesis protein FlhG